MVCLTKWHPIGWSSRANAGSYSWLLLLGLCKWSYISHNLGIILNLNVHPFLRLQCLLKCSLWVSLGSNHQGSLKLAYGFSEFDEEVDKIGEDQWDCPVADPVVKVLRSCQIQRTGLDDLTSLLSLNRVLNALVNVVLDMLVREHLVEFTATLHRPGIPCLFARVQGASAP